VLAVPSSPARSCCASVIDGGPGGRAPHLGLHPRWPVDCRLRGDDLQERDGASPAPHAMERPATGAPDDNAAVLRFVWGAIPPKAGRACHRGDPRRSDEAEAASGRVAGSRPIQRDCFAPSGLAMTRSRDARAPHWACGCVANTKKRGRLAAAWREESPLLARTSLPYCETVRCAQGECELLPPVILETCICPEWTWQVPPGPITRPSPQGRDRDPRRRAGRPCPFPSAAREAGRAACSIGQPSAPRAS
jgi:hypothetical protein